MNIAIFSSLKSWLAVHKKIAVVLLILLLAGLGAGGYFGWEQYKYRQTSQFAFERLKAALMPPDPRQMASLVDFNSISGDLAAAIQKNFPFFMEGADQERNIRHLLQTALLKRFLNKEEPKRAPDKEESEEELLKKDLEILPPDFLTQFLASMNVRETSGDTALITAKVENPLLKPDFTIVLSMHKTRDGWKVRHVANAEEVTAQLREAMLSRHARLRNVYLDKNSATTRRMNQLLPIESCSVNAGLLSDRRTLLMVVHVIARNRGDFQINNFNLDATIVGRSGNVVVRRFLNVARPVAPGEDFNHRWNFELDSSSELAQSILRNEPLQCRAAWQTLGLGNSEVLHIVEVPNPDRQCNLSGHDHPEGFCATPVFQR